jgi:hypothetical protein
MQSASENIGVVVLVMIGFVAISVIGQLIKTLVRIRKR